MKMVLDCELCGREFRVESERPSKFNRTGVPDRIFDINRGDYEEVSFDVVCFDCERALLDAVKAVVKTRKKKGKHASE